MDNLQRVTRDEVPREKRWVIDAVWEIELDRVKNWLADVANASVGRPNVTLEDALEAGASLSDEIRARFAAEVEAVDPNLMRMASLGELERSAPAEGLVGSLGFLRWVAILGETLIFVWLWLMGFGNEVLILMGGMLAGSGFLLGSGAARLVLAHENKHLAEELRGWLGSGIGLIGIIIISVLRAGGADVEGAFAIIATTVMLALIIAVFEALYESLSASYVDKHNKMFRCQGWFSKAQHQKAYDDQLWDSIYKAAVKNSFRNYKKATGETGSGNVSVA